MQMDATRSSSSGSGGGGSGASTVVRVADVSGRTLATVHVRRGDTVGEVRKRLMQQMRLDGFPAGVTGVQLCSQGAVLHDDRLPALDHRELTAWWPRYSRGDAAAASAHAGGLGASASALLASSVASLRSQALSRRAAATARWLAGTVAPELARAVSARPLLLAKLATWTALFYAAHWRLELGGPFLVASAGWAVWQVGFSERGDGEASAYTVFNGGRALPGQLQGEDLQAQMVGM